jgi:hypothetical protein
VALSTWQAGLSRDSAQAHWGVALSIALALALAVHLGRGRQRMPGRSWAKSTAGAVRAAHTQPVADALSVSIWTFLLLAVVAWDLVSFAVQSHSFPTLSYFVGHVTRYPIGRGALFALWLLAGAGIAVGWRAASGRR